jgi:hypothetical protein
MVMADDGVHQQIAFLPRPDGKTKGVGHLVSGRGDIFRSSL